MRHLSEIAISKPTILVLDDDADVLGSLQFLLETHGFTVRTFRSPAAMLSWAKIHPFDCVVVDYKMPDIDGLEVVSRLRGSGVGVPMILVTGFPDELIFTKAAAAGVREVLLKPLFEDSLVARIREYLRESAPLS
jgi:two-component system response regulator FixJ